MSLIEEALRRVQQPLPGEQTRPQQKPSAVQTPPPAAAPAEAPPAHSWETTASPEPPSVPRPAAAPPTVVLVATAVLVVAILMFSGGVFWLGRMSSSAKSLRAKTPRAAPAAAASAPAQVHDGQTYLVLSGVVIGVGAPYAVINGEIVAVGDSIGGATVQEITSNAVLVGMDDGRQATLRVPR